MSHYDNVDNAEMPGDAENWVSGGSCQGVVAAAAVASCKLHLAQPADGAVIAERQASKLHLNG